MDEEEARCVFFLILHLGEAEKSIRNFKLYQNLCSHAHRKIP